MKRIKVAMLAPPWLAIPPKGYGGTENVLAGLIPALQNLNVDVELISVGETTLPNTINHWLYEKGQYNHITKPIYDSLPISIAHLLFGLKVIEENGSFDVIHDHNLFAGPLVLSLASASFPPAIHTLHGPPFTTPDRLKMGLPDNIPMWQQFKDNRKLRFVPISQALAKSTPKKLKRMLLPAVHNGIDVNQYPFVDKKSDYFTTLGRIHPDKGQAIAVRLCLEDGYRLKMAGGVGDISSTKKLLMELANPLSSYRSLAEFRYYSDEIFPHLIDGNIENMGETIGQKKLKLLSNAKALLFPITWDEPFGMAPIEALACGTPVVAMNRGALPEIIEHGVNGFLANNESEFRGYMKRVDEIDPLACRNSIVQRFSAEQMAKKYLEHYQTIIKLNEKPIRPTITIRRSTPVANIL